MTHMFVDATTGACGYSRPGGHWIGSATLARFSVRIAKTQLTLGLLVIREEYRNLPMSVEGMISTNSRQCYRQLEIVKQPQMSHPS